MMQLWLVQVKDFNRNDNLMQHDDPNLQKFKTRKLRLNQISLVGNGNLHFVFSKILLLFLFFILKKGQTRPLFRLF